MSFSFFNFVNESIGRLTYCSSMRIRLRRVSLLEALGGSAVITLSLEPQTSCP